MRICAFMWAQGKMVTMEYRLQSGASGSQARVRSICRGRVFVHQNILKQEGLVVQNPQQHNLCGKKQSTTLVLETYIQLEVEIPCS